MSYQIVPHTRRHKLRTGPLVPQASHSAQAARVAHNGQNGLAQPSAQYNAGGQSNPEGCTRAPYADWHVTESDCKSKLKPGQQCNPRYINGVWSRYMPYAADSVACGGPLPPNTLPQILLAPSLIDTQTPEYLHDVSLSLNEGGNVGVMRFHSMDEATGKLKPVVVKFSQKSQVQPNHHSPLEYYYAVPHESGVMRLTINTMNGHATVTFPHGRFPALVQFQITNIMPWQQSPEDMAAAQLA